MESEGKEELEEEEEWGWRGKKKRLLRGDERGRKPPTRRGGRDREAMDGVVKRRKGDGEGERSGRITVGDGGRQIWRETGGAAESRRMSGRGTRMEG